MPGSEEVGVDLHGSPSTDSFVGLPIKKRKYHIVRSPSPPLISSLLPKEHKLLQKDESITKIETPGLEIVVDCKGHSLVNERISTDGNANLSNEISIGLNLQHSDDKCTSSSEAELGCEGKLITQDELKFQQVTTDSRLLFHQKEPFQHPIGKRINEEKPILSTKYACGGVSDHTELFSPLNGPLGLPIESEQGKLHQSHAECCFDIHHGNLRDLTLFEEKAVVKTKGNLTVSNVGCAHVHESRSHWDLNTSMDTWDGSSSNISVNYAADVMNGLNKKPEVCSKELVLRDPEDSHVTSTKCVHVDGKRSFDSVSCFNGEPCPPTKLTRVKAEYDQSKLENLMPLGNMKIVLRKPVKSELAWRDQGELSTVENLSQLIHLGTPKAEISDVISQEGIQIVCRNKLISHSGIKSEPVEECSQVGMARERISHCPEIHKVTPELPISAEVALGGTETIKALDFVPGSSVPDATKTVLADCVLDAVQMTCSNVAYTKCASSISTDEHCLDSSTVTEAVESGDGEMINVSADIHEDDSPDSGNGMDGSPNVDMVTRQTNVNDNGDHFVNGEMRETLVHETSVEGGVCEEGKMGRVSCGGLGRKEVVDGSGDTGGDGVMISSHVDSKDCTTENAREKLNAPCTDGHKSTLSIEKKKGNSITVPRLKKSSSSAMSTSGSGKKITIKVVRRTPIGVSEQKEHGLKGLETNSNQVARASTSHETARDDGKDKTLSNHDGVEGLADSGKVSLSKFPKSNASVRDDVGTRINHSRIINLAQTCNEPSQERTRSIPGAPMALRTERGRFPHTSFRVGQLHPQGSRDESRIDGHRKFERDRNAARLVGNSGPNFMHMKGRVHNNLDARWDPDCEFSSRRYSSPTGARFLRAKNIATVDAAEHEDSGHIIAPDGVVNPRRSWRRPIHEKLESFRHPPFERGSPVGREAPMPLRLQMVRRPLRIISPDRCISRGDPDMVIVRHEEKLMRDLPDEMMDPLLPPRSQYQRVHNPFVRRERSFSPVEMSPPRSCSPCSWPSPGRSPDQFDVHPELFLRGSQPAFRAERMRSPHQRPCFTDAIMERRHGTPPLIPQLSDEMRMMGPLREHDRVRPFILNRSPSGRILQRSTRGFDMIDSRDRVEGDEYYGPLHSGQFNELVVDGCVSDRRKYRERSRPIRSFRPNEVGDIERFRLHDNSYRPHKSHPGADAEVNEKEFRGSPRDFKPYVNNRIGNPRRLRSVDEYGDNDSFRGEKSGEANLNDTVGLKRGRC